MALSDRWNKARLRALVRRELLDPKERWWDDGELDGYIVDWQNTVQEECEFIWGSATTTTSLSTLTITAVATDVMRLDAVYWDGGRLAGRSKEELDMLNRNWRNQGTGSPLVVYQDDYKTFSLWPPPGTAGTLVLEYPKILGFATDATAMSIPAWTRYSVKNYCLYRAYSRFGPNQDQNIALRRRKKFERQLGKYKTIWTNFFPQKYIALRPGGDYEKDILLPEPPDKVGYNV